MQEKFTEIANKIIGIKSSFAEAISAKGIETAPNAPFQTMVENIGNITSSNDEPQVEEWVKPHDWIDIEAEPLETGEVRVLICDLFGANNNSIYFSRRSGATNIKASIDWGDGTQEEVDVVSANTTVNHDFVGGGTPCDRGYNQYVVRIRFNEPNSAPDWIYFYRNDATSTNNKHNNILWIYGDMRNFASLLNFTNHSSSYSYSPLLERLNLDNTGDITNMSNLCRYCSSLQSIPKLDTKKVFNMANMFNSCYLLKSVPELDASSATNMDGMFRYCYSLKYVSLINTSNVTNMNYLFHSCYSLKTILNLDTSSLTDMTYLFNGCYSLKNIPILNAQNTKNFSFMFQNCYDLEKVSLINTSKVTNATYMFGNCYSLKFISDFDSSSITNMSCMFNNCCSIETIPNLDTINVTNMESMFAGCSLLKSIPYLNTENCTNISYLYSNCKKLTKVPPLDTRKALGTTNNNSHFTGCLSLIDVGTITLSNDIQLVINSKSPLNKIEIAYDQSNPPVFTQTTPIKINYTQLSTESLNKLMEQLPDGNGKTLDLKYNAGSLGCDPSIATAKNWTVLLK